uniref:RNA polymerase sigma-54 factor n=1 Tax=candidate division WOR-3 bacterium TaxID=2052148 RepID=A0A7C4GHA6_UNCW3
MKLTQDLKLTQELRLTPQLMLNLKLLQVTALELEQLIESELEQNPALELADDVPGADSMEENMSECELDTEAVETEGDTDGVQPAQTDATDPEPVANEMTGAENGVPDGSPAEEYSLDELLPDDGGYASQHDSGATDGDGVSAVELAAGPEQNLREALLPELKAVLAADDAEVAEVVLEWLNEDGLLTADVAELSCSLGVAQERLEAVLAVIQHIPPGGIGCRSVPESLNVQLELAGYPPDSLERILVTKHWDLLMRKQSAKLARMCGVDEERLRQAIQILTTLEPRPARRYTGQMATYVSPDFAVEWRDGRLVAVASDDRIPRLRLSQRYVEILRNPRGYTREQVDFARKKFGAALMFLRAIESRRRTVRRLVEMVIEEQRDFFIKGPEFLRPATLRDAARRLGVHASTASRAIAGKYVETAYGIFPLKHFFRSGSDNISRTSIKERIQAMIDAEDKHNPLTDEEVCARLKEQGITISRRTAAKYRAELGIGGLNERRAF